SLVAWLLTDAATPPSSGIPIAGLPEPSPYNTSTTYYCRGMGVNSRAEALAGGSPSSSESVGRQHGLRRRPRAAPQGLGEGAAHLGERGHLGHLDHNSPDRKRLER